MSVRPRALALLLVVAGCGIELPEDKGTSLGVDPGFHFFWMPDGRELLVASADEGSNIHAVQIDGHEVRRVMEDGDDLAMSEPVLSPDASTLYLSAVQTQDDGGAGVYSIPVAGGAPEILVPSRSDSALPCAISPDGELLAYTEQLDTVALYDLVDDVTVDVTFGAQRVDGFTPDGTRLVLLDGDGGAYTAPVHGGALEPLQTPDLPADADVVRLHWEGHQVARSWYLSGGQGAWQLWRADADGTAVAITEEKALERGRFPFEQIHGVVSEDESQALFWGRSERCMQWDWSPIGGKACVAWQHVLVHVDVASGTTTTSAATQDGIGRGMDLSPDGNALVYDGGDALYMVQIP